VKNFIQQTGERVEDPAAIPGGFFVIALTVSLL